MKRVLNLKLFLRILGILLSLVFLTIVGVGLLLSLSLADKNGNVEVSGIREKVVISWDAYGVPSITGESRLDVSFALGYVHGLDRFFQMDMTRRYTAGELSELMGAATVKMDKTNRLFQYRKRAQQALQSLPIEHQEQLRVYADGVNTAVNSLRTRPFEYWFLFEKPRPWLPEDSLLLAYAYYNDMQGNHAGLDRSLVALYETLPTPIADFFAKQGNPWEAAMDDSKTELLDVPTAEYWQRTLEMTDAIIERNQNSGESPPNSSDEDPKVNGSNQWAVSGKKSKSSAGGAMVVNDPHLSTSVPGIWYKVSYHYPETDNDRGSESNFSTEAGDQLATETIEAHGFSLPGIPTVIIGQSKWTAWGFTVSDVDSQDLVEIVLDPEDETRYLHGDESVEFQVEEELIHVRNGEPVPLVVRKTKWGPVLIEKPEVKRQWSMHWTALKDGAVNMEILNLERCRNLNTLMSCLNRCRLPVMNAVAGDHAGKIGWTFFGTLADRPGPAGEFRFNSRSPERIWGTFLDAEKYPRKIAPTDGVLWTANNRVLGSKDYQQLGTSTFATGSRAYQIRERLQSEAPLDISAMVALQHDHEVPFLKRWRDLILSLIDKIESNESQMQLEGEAPDYQKMRELLQNWEGRASTESVAYSLIRSFRLLVMGYYSPRIFMACSDWDAEFNPYLLPYEESIYRLVSSAPNALVSNADIADGLQTVNQSFLGESNDRSWGNMNRLDLVHPLARAVPALGKWLNMPAIPMDGDSYCPKVVRGDHIGSMRMIAIPGALEQSIYQMPTGQSGHPMSKHYDDLHQYWVTQKYLPLKSISEKHRLVLKPVK